MTFPRANSEKSVTLGLKEKGSRNLFFMLFNNRIKEEDRRRPKRLSE